MPVNRRFLLKGLGALAAGGAFAQLSPLSLPTEGRPRQSPLPELFNIDHKLSATLPIRDEMRLRFSLLAQRDGQKRLDARKAEEHVFKRGLNVVLPVGGTSSVTSAGMASAVLQYANFQQTHKLGTAGSERLVTGSDIFNEIISGSAGSFTAPFFKAGQTEGLSVYYHFLKDHSSISLFHCAELKPVMDIDYFFKVVSDYVPLDIEKALAKKGPRIRIQVSTVPQNETATLTDFGSRDELFQAMRASSRQPFTGAKPVTINGQRYFDAGLSDPLCLKKVESEPGNTVSILFSNSLPNPPLSRAKIKAFMGIVDKFTDYPSGEAIYEAALDDARRRDRMEKDGRLLVVYPKASVGSLENSGPKLEGAAVAGMNAFCETVLDIKPQRIDRTMTILAQGSYGKPVPMFNIRF